MGTSEFRRIFEAEPDGIWNAPGRVNLIGEHTDYNGGMVLPIAISLTTSAYARKRNDDLIRIASVQKSRQRPLVIQTRLEDLEPRLTNSWADYPLGVFFIFRSLGLSTGADILLDSRVPLGSGLSSSAALECSVALALNDLCGMGQTPTELALLCAKAENEFVGVPTGVMDQLASYLCQAGNALFIDTSSLESRQIPFNPQQAGFQLIVVDTRVRHQLAGSEYSERRGSCIKATVDLGIKSLSQIAAGDLEHATKAIKDEKLFRRVKHVVTENDRVIRSVTALEDNRFYDFGTILSESHTSLKEDYEVSCRELDLAVESAIASGALGARMVGGGFGGCAIALVPIDLHEEVANHVIQQLSTISQRPPRILTISASGGARRVF